MSSFKEFLETDRNENYIYRKPSKAMLVLNAAELAHEESLDEALDIIERTGDDNCLWGYRVTANALNKLRKLVMDGDEAIIAELNRTPAVHGKAVFPEVEAIKDDAYWHILNVYYDNGLQESPSHPQFTGL